VYPLPFRLSVRLENVATPAEAVTVASPARLPLWNLPGHHHGQRSDLMCFDAIHSVASWLLASSVPWSYPLNEFRGRGGGSADCNLPLSWSHRIAFEHR